MGLLFTTRVVASAAHRRGQENRGFTIQARDAVCLVMGDSVFAKMMHVLLPKQGCQTRMVWLLRDTSCYLTPSGFCLGFRILYRDQC